MSNPFTPGRKIGFDFGDKRIGVATTDAESILVSPHATIVNDEQLKLKLIDIFSQLSPVYVVVGHPIHLSGQESKKTASVMEFIDILKQVYQGLIYLVDERLSTDSAYSQMRDVGKDQKKTKSIIDQIAAVNILERALQNEKSGAKIGLLT